MEDLITFEQSQYIKEIGFSLPVNYYYFGEGKLSQEQHKGNFNDELLGDWYSAPTVSEALLWLEDNKGFEFSNWETLRKDEFAEIISTFHVIVDRDTERKEVKFDTYNSHLFQSKQLSMALEILNSEKPTK